MLKRRRRLKRRRNVEKEEKMEEEEKRFGSGRWVVGEASAPGGDQCFPPPSHNNWTK